MLSVEYFCYLPSPVGKLTLASDGISITGLWLEGQKHYAATLNPQSIEAQLPVFDMAETWLKDYFNGLEPDFTLPLTPKGSPFRQIVWQQLCSIPYGNVTTYGDIARQLTQMYGHEPTSARAVGNAIAYNPILILIPCHRVIGYDGKLTGYAGGLESKKELLTLEKYYKPLY